MTVRNPARIALVLAWTALVAAGCGHNTPTEPWPAIIDPLVYGDGAGTDAEFHAFSGSKYDALAIDDAQAYTGTSSLRFTVPAAGDPSGGYAGGAFVTKLARDLSSFDALSFWVKGSRTATLNEAGFGIDITGPSRYRAVRTAIPVTTSWTNVLVPIPLAARLAKERGLFFLSEGAEGGAGCTVWIDDVQFVRLGAPTKRAVLTTRSESKYVGTTVNLEGTTRTVFNLGGTDTAVVVSHSAAYFTFASSQPGIAAVSDGEIRILDAGTAVITAKLGDLDATGSITVVARVADVTVPAPAPTVPAGNVASLFSNTYANSVPVGTWSATWDQADVTDILVAGNTTKVYQNLVYAGVELAAPLFDASAMDYFHIDIWAPTGTTFRVKLVDFGADGVYSGCPNCGDDRESELTFNAASTPPFSTGTWVGLDIPLASFSNLTSRSHISQIVLSGDTRTVYVDNVYFHK